MLFEFFVLFCISLLLNLNSTSPVPWKLVTNYEKMRLANPNAYNSHEVLFNLLSCPGDLGPFATNKWAPPSRQNNNHNQSTKKQNMVEKKKIALKTISRILFLFCSIFVFLRGKDCFSKYLSKPQSVDYSYRLSGRLPFPSITICSSIFKWDVSKVRVGHFTNA